MRSKENRAALQGFTLVEISIVLVIIGLLVGGILIGGELIRSAELNTMARDVDKYKTSINAFKGKYFGMPGDLNNATDFFRAEPACPTPMGSTIIPGTCNGNGTGQIEQTSITNASVNNEMMRAWEQLALAELIPGDFTGRPASNLSSTTIVPGLNMPPHPRNGFYLLTHRVPSPLSWFSQKGHVIYAFGANATLGSLNARDAYSMDSKYDDGRPGYGWIGQYTNAVQPGCVTAGDADTAVYDLENTEIACQTHFWLRD